MPTIYLDNLSEANGLTSSGILHPFIDNSYLYGFSVLSKLFYTSYNNFGPIWRNVIDGDESSGHLFFYSTGRLTGSENKGKYTSAVKLITLRVESFAGRNFRGYKVSRTPTFKIKFYGD